MSWRRTGRRPIYESLYMNVWEESVELPTGERLDDYSVVDLPDGVLVVVTDTEDRLLLFEEYKYAVDETVLTFPAGGIDPGETPGQAAIRELKEETGYEATEAEVITSLYPYPSKVAHKDYIVRVRNATKVTGHSHSKTEVNSIGELQLVTLSDIHQLVAEGKFNTSYMVAALALAFPEHF